MLKFGDRVKKVLLSAVLISSIISGGMITQSSAATQPIKIMPVGDSCTEGMGDPQMGSYRAELYRMYKNAGLNVDFVGSNQKGPSDVDRDCEGHSGWTIPQVAGQIDGWMRAQNPDVVLLWIGGNDLLQTGKINPTGLGNLIDQILKDKPGVKIFVSDYYPNPDSVVQYNATIPGVVQEKANAGKPVYFVKLSEMGYNKGADTSSDGLHLNPAGYVKAAKVWYSSTINVLKSMGGTTPTNTPTNTPTIEQTIKYGDVNKDGIIDSADFTLLRSYLLGKSSALANLAAADTNADGKIDSADYTLLRKYLLRIINVLPYKN